MLHQAPTCSLASCSSKFIAANSSFALATFASSFDSLSFSLANVSFSMLKLALASSSAFSFFRSSSHFADGSGFCANAGCLKSHAMQKT